VPGDRDDATARRSVVPTAAGRSLWLAAAWTGAGTAVLSAIVSIAVVAVCWLPASAGSGSASSAIRAGMLTFLAALHGGITVDGLSAAFVPLGLTLLVGAVAWRAGCGLADAAADLDEQRPRALVRAVALQTVVFAATCGAAAHFATLGTSSVSVPAAVLAGLVLFAVSGGIAFVGTSSLGDDLADRTPDWVRRAVRAAAAGVTVYLGFGAVLVAGSLVVHHAQVETLSRQVGGGWSGLPILLLGILTAPNAVIAGSSYLAGPGFALGSGSAVSLGSTVHGTLPAFPLLGAVPSGPASPSVWLLAVAAPLVAGWSAARVVRGGSRWLLQLRDLGLGAALAAVVAFVLAWQGGGAVGSGRLHAVGASPWQFALALGGGLAVASTAALGVLAALAWWHGRGVEAPNVLRATLAAVGSVVSRDHDDAEDELDQVS
jgi:hypothetical protein